MKTLFKRWQRGQGMTEYIIIISMVAIAAIVGYQMFGSSVREGAAGNATGMSSSHLDGGGGMVNGQYMTAAEAAKSVAATGAVDMAVARANGGAGGAGGSGGGGAGGSGSGGGSAAAAAGAAAGGGGAVAMQDDSVWDNSASVEVRQAPRTAQGAPEESNLLLMIGIVIAVLVAIYMFMSGDSSKGSGGGAGFGQFDGSIENSTGQGGGGGAVMPSFGGSGGGGGAVIDNSRDVGAGRYQPPVDGPAVEGGQKYGKQSSAYPSSSEPVASSQFPNVGPKTGLKRAPGAMDG